MAVMITLVRAPACHFCEDARAALGELGRDYDLDVEEIEADSDAGAELVAWHRPAMFPLVLIDGAYFSVGRLARGKLRRLLAARSAAPSREHRSELASEEQTRGAGGSDARITAGARP
jgi:hypothetical protein